MISRENVGKFQIFLDEFFSNIVWLMTRKTEISKINFGWVFQDLPIRVNITKNGTSPTTRIGEVRIIKNQILAVVIKMFPEQYQNHQYWTRACEWFQVPFSLMFRQRSNVRLDSYDRSVLRRTVQSSDHPRPPVWFGCISLNIAIFSYLLL